MNEKKKFCPLGNNYMKESGLEALICGDECAWWLSDVEMCAITSIARGLRSK